MGNYKQVIIVRPDLKMGKGKIAAQVAHASVSALEKTRAIHPEWVSEWLREGQKKVILKVNSEDDLIQIYNSALKMGLPAVAIFDKGLTQLPPNTLTTVGIGPAPEKIIDEITGHLKLL